MKTRTVKVTRTLTMSKSVIMEVPADQPNDEIESALYDRCETYEMLMTAADKYDMDEDEERIEVEDTDKPSEDFPITNEEWAAALKHDQLLG